MNKSSLYKIWQLSLSALTIIMLTSCSFSLPGQTTASQVPQEQTSGGQTLPSEADLYATAIASLGGQLTETAVLQFPTPKEGESTLPLETPMPGEATLEGGGGNTSGTEPGTPQANARGTSTPSTNKTKTPTPKSGSSLWATFTPSSGLYVGGGGPTTYIVQHGDWLYKIAQKFGVSANAIIAANPSLAYNPSHIYTGQVLIIPGPGTYGYGPETYGYGTYYYPIATSVWIPEYYWSYGTPLPYSTSVWLPEQYWGYGPDTWGGLSSSYAICSSGRAQSPINIDTAHTQSRSIQLEFNYSPQKITLVSNDYSFQADFPGGNYVKIDGVMYQLIDIAFHMPGEHTINNHVFDMELQFVHQNSQGQIAIVSVLINKGNNNSNLEPIWSEIPAPPYNWTEVNNFNASGLLPSDLRAYRYTGSITSPPCTENVNWIVLASPIEISQDQLDEFSSMFPGNARPVQPLNNRIVYSNFSGE